MCTSDNRISGAWNCPQKIKDRIDGAFVEPVFSLFRPQPTTLLILLGKKQQMRLASREDA
jgi:hypothetical protein